VAALADDLDYELFAAVCGTPSVSVDPSAVSPSANPKALAAAQRQHAETEACLEKAAQAAAARSLGAYMAAAAAWEGAEARDANEDYVAFAKRFALCRFRAADGAGGAGGGGGGLMDVREAAAFNILGSSYVWGHASGSAQAQLRLRLGTQAAGAAAGRDGDAASNVTDAAMSTVVLPATENMGVFAKTVRAVVKCCSCGSY
jgi:hypothetical protein